MRFLLVRARVVCVCMCARTPAAPYLGLCYISRTRLHTQLCCGLDYKDVLMRQRDHVLVRLETYWSRDMGMGVGMDMH